MANKINNWFADSELPEDSTPDGWGAAGPTLAELLARAISGQKEADRMAAVVRGAAEVEPGPVVAVFDNYGIVWPIEDVRVLDGIPLSDRALVRLGFPGGVEGSFVMPLRDFTDLMETCGLRPMIGH